MLATLGDKQNDPHDVIDISPDVVLASRANTETPALAPEIAPRPEPKLETETAGPATAGPAPSVDAAVRAALSDFQASRKRSSIGKWLRGAMLSVLFAAASAASAIAWQVYGDTAKQMVAPWLPALIASPAQIAETEAAPPAAPAPQEPASTEQAAPAATAPAQQQDSAAAAAPAAAPDATQSLQAMAQDLAAMGQQIEQLKSNIAELKAGQEQMSREIAKAQQPKPAEAKVVEPRARTSALPPRPPARKPKPVYPPAHVTTYAPAPIAPPPQAAVPPPPPPAATATADDDGPVVRPPMPVR